MQVLKPLSDLSSVQNVETYPSLVVLDHPTVLSENDELFNILKKPNVHIVIICKDILSFDSLPKEINTKLVRGTDVN